MRRHVEACRVVIENTMLVFFDMKFSGETRNSVGRRGLPRQSDVFLVEPDKLDIKRHLRGFYLSCIINRFNGEKTAKQMKSWPSFVRICCGRTCVMM